MTYFTKTELEILKHIKSGIVENYEIAKCMFLSEHTVRCHVANIRSKLGCHSMAELVYKLFYINEIKLMKQLNNTLKEFGYEITKIQEGE